MNAQYFTLGQYWNRNDEPTFSIYLSASGGSSRSYRNGIVKHANGRVYVAQEVCEELGMRDVWSRSTLTVGRRTLHCVDDAFAAEALRHIEFEETGGPKTRAKAARRLALLEWLLDLERGVARVPTTTGVGVDLVPAAAAK